MASATIDSRPMSGFMSGRHMGSRAQSFSSDRPSVSTLNHSLTAPPLSVSPEAAFITETAASQIITNNHDSHASTWYDQNSVEPAEDAAFVSPAALSLVNAFLDQLLFNFLQVAKSTSLAALRPAVSEILKPKLARDTIHNADEELREYLGDADEEDYVQPENERDWDLELAWKRARLRCMVYSSLGDLEEEDEDMYMQQENLEVRASETASDVISAAVAIFLTSVIEYMGELTLTVAGQVAYQRVQSKMEREIRDGTRNPNDRADRLIIDEMDMERVAFDRTLGRLWRAWKKRLRGPTGESFNRPFSVCSGDLMESSYGSRSFQGDLGEMRRFQDHSESTIVERVQPADIPLPIGENDVAEIEVPGLVHHSDDDSEGDVEEVLDAARPKSLVALPTYEAGLRVALLAERRPFDPMQHRRSYSSPVPRPLALYPRAARSGSTKTAGRAAIVAGARPVSQQSSAASARNRLRKLTTGTSAGTKARSGDASQLDSDDALEHATYEKAEIVKSSRVSVASASSRTASDAGGAMGARRTSSDHSARIIDVPAPRSPAHSHRQSLDTPDRLRPASVSSSTCRSPTSAVDSPRKTKASDHGPRTAPAPVVARSPVDMVRPSLQSASTISESDEEADDRAAKTPAAPSAFSPARSRDPMGRVPYGLQTNVSNADGKSSSPKADQLTPSNKMAILPKGDTKGMMTAERTKTKEMDDEMTIPLHSVVPPRPIHTSGSSGSSGTGRLKALRAPDELSSRAESVARNFEQLIHSNQTISYTLTPENMRNMDVKSPIEGPVVSKISRKSDELRSPTMDGNGSPLGRRVATSISPVSVDSEANKPIGPVPRAPTRASVSSVRTGGPQARDARVPVESMADFAEFIKSTGPLGDKGPAVLRNVPVPTSPTKRDSGRRVSITSNRSNNSISRSRYQPRDPVVDHQRDHSDLIDFIRQGPPSAVTGQHRIPRHVAPFRSTMDSDQFNAIIGGKGVDAIPEIRYSQTSNSLTENSMPSMQSISSSSALLRHGVPNVFGDEDDMMPLRKTRRVRDPYALDFSDEEDGFDDYDSGSAGPSKREESLAEFLRNCEPPAPPAGRVVKKASSPSLMSRFSRGGQVPMTPTSPSGFIGIEPAPPLSARSSGSKHIPLVVNMPPGYDKYGPIPGYEEAADAGRMPMRKFEPRDPKNLGQTAELASFLRNTVPPPGRELPQIPGEEGTGISKMLRRKKTTPI